MLTDALRQRARAYGTWFHSFDFGGGAVVEGTKPLTLLEQEWRSCSIPDLHGRTVLDIGSWDGWFAFRAEREGASRVVALDYYAWAMDHEAQRRYWARCREQGVQPETYELVPELWDVDRLPGREGFEIARAVLDSKVEAVVADFPHVDARSLGTFDVVFFLGVLYHLENPFAALRRLRELTGALCVIETVCVVVPGQEHHPLWEFFGRDELNGDPSNWWAGNAAGLESMCLAAGFGRVEFVGRPAETAEPAPGYDYHYGRARLHAYP